MQNPAKQIAITATLPPTLMPTMVLGATGAPIDEADALLFDNDTGYVEVVLTCSSPPLADAVVTAKASSTRDVYPHMYMTAPTFVKDSVTQSVIVVAIAFLPLLRYISLVAGSTNAIAAYQNVTLDDSIHAASHIVVAVQSDPGTHLVVTRHRGVWYDVESDSADI